MMGTGRADRVVTPVAPSDPFPERGEIPHAVSAGALSGLIDSTIRATRRSLQFSLETVTCRRSRAFAAKALPVPGMTPLAGLHGALDELILVYFAVGRTGPLDVDFTRIELEVEDLIIHHDHRGVSDDPFSMHDDPPAPTEHTITPRRFGGVDGEWMTFASDWEPHPRAPGRRRWLSDEHNRIVHVGLLRHDDGPRPWLLLLHGAEMGRPRLDARLLRAERLHQDLGVNIAMPVLPKHGPRGAHGVSVRGTFPSLEMADNVHGLSQGIWDVRRTLSWIRTQDPVAIGAYGFSLGAYLGSLLGGLEPTLDALVLGCPVVDLVDLFIRNTPPLDVGGERLAMLFERAAIATSPIAPLLFERVLPRDRIALIGAANDRLSDPVDQLSRLWEHWDRPEVTWFGGGHVSYFMGNEPILAVEEILTRRGVAA